MVISNDAEKELNKWMEARNGLSKNLNGKYDSK